MKHSIFILALAVLKLQAGASIEGQVNLDKAPKPRPPSTRYASLKVGPPPPRSAVIYLEGNFPPLATNKTARLEQKTYQFSATLLPVQTGTMVEFPNLDDEYHHVLSLSAPKHFDLGHYRKDEKPAAQKFDKPGVVRLFCEIHEHMRAAILVLDTPHFTTAAPDGKYRLENLPEGSYKLKAWLDERIIWEKAVELKEGQTLKVDFTGK